MIGSWKSFGFVPPRRCVVRVVELNRDLFVHVHLISLMIMRIWSFLLFLMMVVVLFHHRSFHLDVLVILFLMYWNLLFWQMVWDLLLHVVVPVTYGFIHLWNFLRIVFRRL